MKPIVVYRRALQFFVAGAGAPLGVRSAAQLLEVRRIASRALERDWNSVGEDIRMALETHAELAHEKRFPSGNG